MRKGSLENAEAEALITVALAAAQRRDDVAIQKKTWDERVQNARRPAAEGAWEAETFHVENGSYRGAEFMQAAEALTVRCRFFKVSFSAPRRILAELKGDFGD